MPLIASYTVRASPNSTASLRRFANKSLMIVDFRGAPTKGVLQFLFDARPRVCGKRAFEEARALPGLQSNKPGLSSFWCLESRYCSGMLRAKRFLALRVRASSKSERPQS
jgi:hypothetical protein